MEMAELISTWSKDPSKQIGAVAVKDRRILAQGYNGLPKGLPDTAEYLDNREVKYVHIIHAEENVIINAAKNGVSLEGSTVYIYGLAPCSSCAGKLVNAGVEHVVFMDIHDDPRWEESQRKSEKIFEYGGVIMTEYAETPDQSTIDEFVESFKETLKSPASTPTAICNACGHPEHAHPYRHPFIPKTINIPTVFSVEPRGLGQFYSPPHNDVDDAMFDWRIGDNEEEEVPDDWKERQRKRYNANPG